MASVRTWTRLEPRARGDDLSPSLEARVHDPAWLVGRQWQLGELVGEDAGTPVHVAMQVQASPIVAYSSGGRDGAVEPGTPIDCVMGAEPRCAPSWIERAEAGAELLQLLADAGCSERGAAALVDGHVMPASASETTSGEGGALLSLCAGRLPDGLALAQRLEDIARLGRPPAALRLSASDATAVVAAATAWVAWRAAVVDTAPASSWVSEQLEHHFALAVQPATGAAFALTAPAWDGEPIDWYDVDVDRRARVPALPGGAALPSPPGLKPIDRVVSVEGLPAPLSYPGMPAPRWWQFEDARVNFARIAAAPEDLARMLVVEFASVHGNDWYLWPLDLPIGAIHQITALEVVNTFGDRVTVHAAGLSAGGSPTLDWQLFRLTEQRATGPTACDGLLLLPSLVSPIEGETLEDVHLLRDEVANLAWAIETTVRGRDGLPMDRHSAAAAAGELGTSEVAHATADTAPLRYRFETEVPVHWFPLAADPSGAPKFRLLLVRRVDEAGEARDVPPLGELLAPGLWIWQEEVPREGARVIRRHLMARGGDGRLHVWCARRAQTGRGEGASGLSYDAATPAPEEPAP